MWSNIQKVTLQIGGDAVKVTLHIAGNTDNLTLHIGVMPKTLPLGDDAEYVAFDIGGTPTTLLYKWAFTR